MQRQPLANEQTRVVHEITVEQVTLLGDSTIDNRVWVDGIAKSYLNARLGIKRDEPAVRVKKSHRAFAKPTLSITENMMDLLPNHVIHDYTNDGFTTSDILNGQHRDKVLRLGNISLLPHELFEPLEAGSASIKNSQHIILSIGGNDFREFLQKANAKKTQEEKKTFIRENFDIMFASLKQNYISIINNIREQNPSAKIILMTQYYPSAVQNDYKIYPFMEEIGKILKIGGRFHDPMSVIHEIMKKTYTDVLKEISPDNIIVADITSSLNPFDNKNHLSQIEPSGLGGRKIAQMLKYIITSAKVVAGQAYRFYPEFFTSTDQDLDLHVEGSDFKQWQPAHLWDLREAYSLEQEKVFRRYKADILDAPSLLQQLSETLQKQNNNSALYKAALAVQKEAERLSHFLPEDNLKKWKMSVVLALNVLETPKTQAESEQTNPDYLKAVSLLESHAKHSALGKADNWKKLQGALAMLASVALITLCVALAPLSAGATAALGLTASLFMVTGLSLFTRHRQKSQAQESATLVKEARGQLNR